MKKRLWIIQTDLPLPYRSINLYKRDEKYQLPLHQHDTWQIIIVTEGNLQITTTSGTDTLYAGFVHILPPTFEHSLSSLTGDTQFGIELLNRSPDSRILNLLKQNFTKPISFPLKHALSLTAEIIECHRLSTFLSETRLMNLVDSLLLSCIESQGSATSSQFEKQLLAYLDTNLHLPLRLSEIASHFYTSTPNLERLCHRSFNTGVIDQLQKCRFHRAQQLLIDSDLSVKEIGNMVGYSDPAQFSAFFRNIAGVSPRQYRSQSKLYM